MTNVRQIVDSRAKVAQSINPNIFSTKSTLYVFTGGQQPVNGLEL